jgi:coenzyme F420 hydrogenase subunit beta
MDADPPSGRQAGRGNTQWRELAHEVLDPNLCTGCAACVMACPRDVLGYDHTTTYRPFNIEPTTAADDCLHGRRGCDICTRACPRFRAWEPEGDLALFGRTRAPEEVSGVVGAAWLTRAADPELLAAAQDGGLVTALLDWGLGTDRIEGVLTSRTSPDRAWDAEPFLATDRAGLLEAAGSRYAYAAAPLAMKEAEARKLRRLALVGMGCQAAVNGTLQARSVNKYARRIELVIGLLCSKSFDYEGMRKIVEEDYGVPLDDVVKVNIKGRFSVWRRSTGDRVDIPLKVMAPAARSGCALCPDFAAEHADISAGGLGQDGWTLTLLRTQRGHDWFDAAVEAGVLEAKPADTDPAALALMDRLSARSRARWPETAPGGPGLLPIVTTS